MAVIHIPVYLSAKTSEAEGNCHADAATRDAAMRGQPPDPATPVTVATTMTLSFPIPESPDLLPCPKYTPQDLQWTQEQKIPGPNQNKWFWDTEGKPILPTDLGYFLFTSLRTSTHLGHRKLLDLMDKALLWSSVQQIIDGCQAMKPCRKGSPHTGIQVRGQVQGRSWELDFTEVKPGKSSITTSYFLWTPFQDG